MPVETDASLPAPVETDVPLAPLTTLRVGGPAARLVTVTSAAEAVAAVQAADAARDRVLVLAGGSNVVVSDDGWDGTVVLVRSEGVEVLDAGHRPGGAARVRVAAGHSWDDLVAEVAAGGWSGIEALSGIPGSTGATPIQNVGAYGQEVSQTIAEVRVWDRVQARERTLDPAGCAFAYRDSHLKRTARDGPGGTDRYLVLDVTFELPASDGMSAPVAYAQLARHLGVETGARVPLVDLRTAVLDLRRSKGMVLDPDDHDTWSVGSFFTNPVLDADTAARLPDDAPRWPAGDGLVKIPAAWLIEHAGVQRGRGLPGPAAVSTRHTLALTNRGSATTADVLALAREVRDAVGRAFAVTLVPEPRLVGTSL